MKRDSLGDVTVKAPVSSRDEVGTLAIAFNRMAEDLAHSKEEIYQYSKTLEQKVRQRTLELKIINH